jgi:polysaccharide export outer membrane protein
MRATTLLWLWVVGLGTVGPVAAQPVTRPDTIVLQPGDGIRLSVWRRPELSGDFSIAGDGTIRHPLLRNLVVTGAPFAAVEQRLRDFLRQLDVDPQLVAEPLFRVAVSGEVRQPTLLLVPPEVTLTQAVAQAGPTELARLDRVVLIRGDERRVINLINPDDRWARATVRSGDQVIVPRRRPFAETYLGPVAGVLSAVFNLVTLIVTVSR